jgi:hypothetical protein
MKNKNILIAAGTGLCLLGGSYFYMSQNIIPALLFGAAAAFLYFYTRNSPEYGLQPGESEFVFNALLAVSIAFIALRFFRITSFPYDYYADEWNEPTLAYWKLSGDMHAFDYSKRLGTALPYFTEAVYAVYLFIFRDHIELLRTAPALAAAATAVELYFLGKTLKDRSLGIALMFVYSVSGWAFFISRELMVIVYLPFLAITFLLLFFMSLQGKNRELCFAGAGLVLFAGFFTYSAWIIMVPFAAYLLFEYRQELGEDRTKAGVMFMVAAVTAAGFAYLAHKNIIDWAVGRTFVKKNATLMKFASNFLHIPQFFAMPVPSSNWFTGREAVLSFPELIVFAGGIYMCCAGIKEKFNRVMLAGLLLSFVTLVISSEIEHHLRHIMILPFLVIISGMFLRELLRWRYSAYVAALSACFLVITAMYMFLDWNRQLGTDRSASEIAGYINSNYRGGEYLLLHESAAYGNYSVFLRTKAAFVSRRDSETKEILILTISPMRYVLRRMFPGAKMKYFYDYNDQNRYPSVLCEVDAGGDGELVRYFSGMQAELRKIDVDLWGLEYDRVIKECDENLEKTKNDRFKILKNTFLRLAEFEAYGRLEKGKETMDGLLNTEKPMFVTADWFYHLARVYYRTNDPQTCVYYLKKAIIAMPEWETPRIFLANLAKEGYR